MIGTEEELLLPCSRCHKKQWFWKEKRLDGEVYCESCYNIILEEKKKKKKYITDHVKLLIDNGLSELIWNFFAKRYNKEKAEDELIKLQKLLKQKHNIDIDYSLFFEIVWQVREIVREEKELKEFEDDITPQEDKKKLYKKMEKKFHCIRCKQPIDEEVFGYSTGYFGKPLCIEHQGTKTQKDLFFALRKSGIDCEYEKWDGYKHVDISIKNAKLNIEVDGEHHLTNADQLLSTLSIKYKNI